MQASVQMLAVRDSRLQAEGEGFLWLRPGPIMGQGLSFRMTSRTLPGARCLLVWSRALQSDWDSADQADRSGHLSAMAIAAG